LRTSLMAQSRERLDVRRALPAGTGRQLVDQRPAVARGSVSLGRLGNERRCVDPFEQAYRTICRLEIDADGCDTEQFASDSS
jgi:hypothetical protein